MIIDRRRNKKQQDLRLSTNLTRLFVLHITLPKVQNEEPLKIVLKTLQNGSNVIVDRSRNEKQQDLRLSTNLTRVFVLYITLPKVQNEDPFKISSRGDGVTSAPLLEPILRSHFALAFFARI